MRSTTSAQARPLVAGSAKAVPASAWRGQVAPGDLRLVLDARDPGSGARLTATKMCAKRRVAGFDLTFSAPKSVSLLYAFGDDQQRNAVRRAHDQAVTSVLEHLEDQAAQVRRGKDGLTRIDAEGFVAAAFVHRTSRNGDPQLHSHVLVANVTRGFDGRWSAPDAHLLYTHARSAGSLYKAALRAELASTLGVHFTEVHKGSAEIAGISAELRGAFSSRRAEILEYQAERGETSSMSAERAALATRAKKDLHALGGEGRSLQEHWLERAGELGVDPSLSPSVTGPPRNIQLDPAQERELVRTLLSPAGLTAQASTFERRSVVQAVAEALPDGAAVAEIDGLTERILADPEVVKLASVGLDGKLRRTTTELLDTEAALVACAVGRRQRRVAVVKRQHLQQALRRRPELSDEQRQMVRRFTTAGHGVDGVVGRAGTGKTTALAAVHEAFSASGYQVTGLALSAKAAQGLERGANMPSLTLARFQHQFEQGQRQLSSKDVLVLDEAGMVGTRDLNRLLHQAETAGAKVIVVGDHRQLPEIAAGGAFRALSEQLAMPELTTNRRQVEIWEREALEQLRHGDVQKAVASYVEHDRVQLGTTMADTQTLLVATWSKVRAEPNLEMVMLAAHRTDVDALNVLARQDRRAQGQLGADLEVPGSRPFAVGDEVVALRNNVELDVLNGTRGTVQEVNDDGLVLSTEEGTKTLSPEYLAEGHLDYGYATTVHKAQGVTCDRALVLGGQGLSRELGYVAMSRARSGTDLFVPTAPLEDGFERDRDDLVELATRLSQSRAKELASEHLELETAPTSEATVPEPPSAMLPPSPFKEPDLLRRSFRRDCRRFRITSAPPLANRHPSSTSAGTTTSWPRPSTPTATVTASTATMRCSDLLPAIPRPLGSNGPCNGASTAINDASSGCCPIPR